MGAVRQLAVIPMSHPQSAVLEVPGLEGFASLAHLRDPHLESHCTDLLWLHSVDLTFF